MINSILLKGTCLEGAFASFQACVGTIAIHCEPGDSQKSFPGWSLERVTQLVTQPGTKIVISYKMGGLRK